MFFISAFQHSFCIYIFKSNSIYYEFISSFWSEKITKWRLESSGFASPILLNKRVSGEISCEHHVRLRWQMTLWFLVCSSGRMRRRIVSAVPLSSPSSTHNNCFSSLSGGIGTNPLCACSAVYARLTFQILWNHRSSLFFPYASVRIKIATGTGCRKRRQGRRRDREMGLRAPSNIRRLCHSSSRAKSHRSLINFFVRHEYRIILYAKINILYRNII